MKTKIIQKHCDICKKTDGEIEIKDYLAEWKHQIKTAQNIITNLQKPLDASTMKPDQFTAETARRQRVIAVQTNMISKYEGFIATLPKDEPVEVHHCSACKKN